MKDLKRYLPIIICLGAILLLITQGQIARQGAFDGIDLCMRVVIPSIFPFLLITSWLNYKLIDLRIPLIIKLGRIVRMPQGTESILLLGLIGGYPVGSRCIGEMYRNEDLNKHDAMRMLAFCNNAGPAYIFGVTCTLFQSPLIPWLLWFIHIISALMVGIVLRSKDDSMAGTFHSDPISIAQALKHSLISMATICGWIIIFKTFLGFIACIPIPNTIFVIICGILELSTGTLALAQIKANSLRFILCSVFLSFGGICVWLQTSSVVGNLGTGLFPHGKIMQTGFSLAISLLLSIIIFQEHSIRSIDLILLLIAAVFMVILPKTISTKKLWKLQQ